MIASFKNLMSPPIMVIPLLTGFTIAYLHKKMKKNKKKSEALARLQAPTPSFWKKIGNIGIAIGSAGAAILAIPASVVVLPAALVTAGVVAVAVGTVAKGLSSFGADPHDVKTIQTLSEQPSEIKKSWPE